MRSRMDSKVKTTRRQMKPLEPAPQKTKMMVPPLALTPDSGLDVWIAARQACEILDVKGATIYRLANAVPPFLLTKRPLPKKILISLRSVKALAEATKNPRFWTSPVLQEEHQRKLREIAEDVALKMPAV